MRPVLTFCAMIAVLSGSALITTAWADAPFAPPTPLIDSGQAKSGPKFVVQAFRLDGIKGTLEKTTFAEVQQRFGGRVERQGDAGASLSWLCYDLPAQHLRVWLTSDEIHGHSLISGVTIWTVASPANSPQCPVIAGNPSAEIDGVSVGQAEDSLKMRLGAPGLAKEGWSAYYHTVPLKGGGTEEDSLVVKADGGRIGYLQAWRLTSY